MSGHWEVVGKKKDRINGKVTQQKSVRPIKVLQKEINVEEVLPMSQIKNLYSVKNKDNQKHQEKIKVVENGMKKPQQQQKKPEKKQESKVKLPKSIESALNSISADDFNAIYERNKELFPDTPIVWLKELAQFLNQKVPIEIVDPLFSNKPDNYPLSVVPSPIKNIMEKAVQESGSNTTLFFEICITTMANDMNKDLSTLGHKLFLQYLATSDPQIVLNNLPKYVVLRNSYQNRQTIGLSILWALGQAGLQDVNIGLKVFQEVMYPLIEMKNYSRYIIKYLIAILNSNDDLTISKDHYLFVSDVAYSEKKNVPNDVSKELLDLIPNLNMLLLKKNENEKYYSYIEPVLKKLVQTSNVSYRKQLCDILILFVQRDHTCLGTWGKVYTKNLPASSIFLNYIDKKWKHVSKQINIKVFFELLQTLIVTNDELMTKKRKEDGLLECIEAIKKLTGIMASEKKGARFPKKLLFYLFVLVVSLTVYIDVQQNGSWQNSTTLKALNRSGMCDYTNKALVRAKEGTVWVHDRLEEQFPGVTDATIEMTTPYIELGRDMGLIVKHVAVNMFKGACNKLPQVAESIESYAPGFLNGVQEITFKAWAATTLYFDKSRDFLLTEIFVGKLSPDEIQKTILLTYEAGLDKACECYHWIYEKISNSIK